MWRLPTTIEDIHESDFSFSLTSTLSSHGHSCSDDESSLSSNDDDDDDDDDRGVIVVNATAGGDNNRTTAARMKRSPYLSVMAGSTKEQEDLVAMLSRPSASSQQQQDESNGCVNDDNNKASSSFSKLSKKRGLSKLGRGGGGDKELKTFFDLKRPSSSSLLTPSPSNPLVATAPQAVSPPPPSQAVGPVSFAAVGQQQQQQQTQAIRTLQPSLRSSLRMGSRTEVRTSSRGNNINNIMNNNLNSEMNMKKNASVTFSNTTKKHHHPPQQNQHQNQFPKFGNYNSPSCNSSPSSNMKKAQSIAAPQFLASHNNGGPGNCGGNASFPIYLGKMLPNEEQKGVVVSPEPSRSSPYQYYNSIRSKSMHALRYCYNDTTSSAMDPAQKLLRAAGMTNNASMSRSSALGLNLTMKDMLDECEQVDTYKGGHGRNSRSARNDRWKDFGTFSNAFGGRISPLALSLDDDDHHDGVEEQEQQEQSSGSSSEEPAESSIAMPMMGTTVTTPRVVASRTSSFAAMTGTGIPLSGSKRAMTQGALNSRKSIHNNNTMSATRNNFNAPFPIVVPRPQGSHRASVSVNDLAVLRRSAARMNGNNNNNKNNVNTNVNIVPNKRPGDMLGGDMLRRIPSSNTSGRGGCCFNAAGATTTIITNTNSSQSTTTEPVVRDLLSPLAQMLSKTSVASFGNPSSRLALPPQGNISSSSGSNSGTQLGGGTQNQKFHVAVDGSSAVSSFESDGSNNNDRQHQQQHQPSSVFPSHRRSRTVGAGLAYGRANMTCDYKSGGICPLTKFDYGRCNTGKTFDGNGKTFDDNDNDNGGGLQKDNKKMIVIDNAAANATHHYRRPSLGEHNLRRKETRRRRAQLRSGSCRKQIVGGSRVNSW